MAKEHSRQRTEQWQSSGKACMAPVSWIGFPGKRPWDGDLRSAVYWNHIYKEVRQALELGWPFRAASHYTPVPAVDFCLQSGGWVLRQVCRGQHPGWDWGMDVSKPHSWELENKCLGPGGKARWDSRPPLLLGLWDSAAGGRVRGSTEVDSVGRDQTTEGLGSCLRDFRLYIYIYIYIYIHIYIYTHTHVCVCEENHFLKSLLNLLQFCFCFMFCFLAKRHVAY